jgi:16S rRNA processing protein RimM
MAHWWLCADPEGDAWRETEVSGLRTQGAGWVAKLEGIDDRDAAERLDGWYIGAPREAMPGTTGNEFYWADLIGLAVMNEQGEFLGKVDSLIETGAHQVLVVKDGQDGETKERLLPFVETVVRSVDVAGGRIRVEWGKDW